MKRVLAVLSVGAGVAALCLGLLFLVGSGGQAHRLVVGAVGLLGGGALVGLGVRLFRQAALEDPTAIEAAILALAKREDGEISEDELRAQLGPRWTPAQGVLLRMQGDGSCQLSRLQGGAYYRFPHLLPRLAVRRCQFCEAELPLDDDLVSCPQCGGTIRTGVQRLALGDDALYKMDD